MSDALIILFIFAGITLGGIGLGIFLGHLDNRPLFKKGDKLVKEESEHWESQDLLVVLEVGKRKYLVEDKAHNKRTIHKEDLECEYERLK